jgi:hypothetical protein
MGAGAERLPAARGPGPESCEHRVGSRQFREVHAACGDRGQGLGGPRAAAGRGGSNRPGPAGGLPAGAGPAWLRPFSLARRFGERYPDLKATANFRDLQAQLEGTENRIAVERGRFNDVVQAYDTAIRRFPAVFFAGMFGFSSRPYFTATTGSEVPPKVQFDFGNAAPAKP